MGDFSSVLNWVLIAFTGFAGFFWLLSATARVKPQEPDTGEVRIIISDGPGESNFAANGIDVLATARVQTKWNTWAASFACAAAFCPAVIYCLPKTP